MTGPDERDTGPSAPADDTSEGDPGVGRTDDATDERDPSSRTRADDTGEGDSTAPRRVDDATAASEDDSTRSAVPRDERALKSAVTRRDTEESVTDALTPAGPLEPQEIDPENAAFVLLGVVLVVGFLFVAIAGI